MGYRDYHLLSELETQIEDDFINGRISFPSYKQRLQRLYAHQRFSEYEDTGQFQLIDGDFDDQLGYDAYIRNTSVGEYA